VEEETGVKEEGKATPDPAEAGVKDPSTPGEVEFKEDEAKELEGKKWVPLEAVIAERKKRQELKGEEKPPEEPATTPAFDWDAILGTGKTEEKPTATAAEAAPSATDQTKMLEDWVRENIQEYPIQTLAYVFNLFEAQRNQMRRQARQFVGDEYDKLPIHNVSDEEVVALQQNPEAMRALLAAVKYRKTTSSSEREKGNNSPFAAREQELIEEGRRKALEELARASGTAGEGPAPSSAATEEIFELDEQGKEYARRRGITDPKELAEFAKLYKAEIERRTNMR